MNKLRASYAIVQYSPQPERFEAVNVGVVVFDHLKRVVLSRLSVDVSRVKRLSKDVNKVFVVNALSDFVSRLEYEFLRSESLQELQAFREKRSNNFNLTPIVPVIGDNLNDQLESLFLDLVGEPHKKQRSERVSSKLRSALKSEGVIQLLDKRPKPVSIERYGVLLRPEYGFQNGHYNLIDAARFDSAEEGLAEAGKRALEGRALAESLNNRLVVIGDFGDQPNDFFEAIRDDLERASTKLYRMDDLASFSVSVRQHCH